MNQNCTVKIHFPDEGIVVEPSVAKEGEFTFRLLEQPSLVESAAIFDLIEVKPCDEDTFELVRVVVKSGWRVNHFLLTEPEAKSDSLQRLLRKVEGLGGRWELELGGCLTICLPPEVTYDPSADVSGLDT